MCSEGVRLISNMGIVIVHNILYRLFVAADCLGDVSKQENYITAWFRENWEQILYILYYIWSGYWWLIVSVAFVFMVFVVVGSLLEVQLLHPLKPSKEPGLKQQNPYTRRMNEMARKLGFRECEWFVDRRRSFLYGATVTMWLSPDALTLACVFGGKMMGLKVKQTLLISKPVSGVMLMTTDIIADPDISGLTDQRELLRSGMDELYELHKKRLEECEGKLQVFKKVSLLEEFENFQRRRVEVLVDHGLAKWTGRRYKKWRYSIIGALQRHRAFRGDWKRMMKQREMEGKKRPAGT